ncbi:ATP-grasp domain-containing protein [Kordiimonas aestuarii]|uniref:ATP-grasp domain-containing protein n=1 Tax=Kordiimonas aestuarii TaxID=1005925 RepID=UPI0021D3C6D3|nr:ATP-grasp domain-containing protein [Kordiimonas aestuarii]
MVKKQNVLVFPCGSEIGLEVHAALKYEKSVTLFGASSVDDHGRMVFRRYIGGLPYCSDDGFDGDLQAVIDRHDIDVVIPAHDSVLLYLAENRDKFSAKVLAPDAGVCHVCRSKKRTYDALGGAGFVPAYYASPADVPAFPVFMKPDIGQGSQGVVLAPDKAACEAALQHDAGLLLCEYLPGAEYTIDCYTSRTGELLFCSPRERMRTKSGISVRSKNVSLGDKVRDIAETISSRIGMQGVWFFQLKEAADGTLKLLEVAPRVAGSMSVHRVMGVNFVLLGLFELMGFDVAVIPPAIGDIEVDRALSSRYVHSFDYDTVYLDLDDTLIVDGELNETVLMFVYQCKRLGRRVRLITRHFQQPDLTLEALAVHTSLFSDVIWITDTRPKSSFIGEGERAIFIDDSYKERLDVARTKGIPAIGPDAVEALLDWRR